MNSFISMALAFGLLFLILIVPIVLMWHSLLKHEDELRKMIVEKSCTETFIVYILMLVINIFGSLFTNFSIFENQANDIVTLAIIAFLFNITLFLNKRKFG